MSRSSVKNRTFREARLPMAVVSALFSSGAWAAPNVDFNPQFLQGGGSSLDLSRFEKGEDLPGVYSADIHVNGAMVARRDVELREQPDGSSALCLTPQLLQDFGLDAARLPRPGEVNGTGNVVDLRPLPEEPFCDPLSAFVPDAVVSLDTGEQVLKVDIPQAYLLRDPRGWVSPELWDDGITAARIGYSISHQRLNGGGINQQNSSATLNMGLNVGGWRLHHDGYLSQGGGHGAVYRAGRSHAKRAIAPLDMELTLGEASTTGDLFAGVNFRGASLSSDPRMLPDSLSGYAPVVRGVARTTAKVVIRQRDYIIYQTNVAAGPFEIDDLYGTGYAGDLDVEVVEDDGRVQRFTVPFAAVPQLLRAGQSRVTVTAGQLNDQWLDKKPAFAEATVRRGVSNAFTGYGGVTGTEGYGAVVLGGALNTRVGAFAGDVTVSHAALPAELSGHGKQMYGQSFRVTYSKDISVTHTHIAVAAYRYSTDGFLTLIEATRLREDLRQGQGGHGVARPRSRMDLTVNQRLADRGGSLYASANSITYWNQNQRRTNFSLGYSNTLGQASYSISAQRSLERSLFDGATARESNSVNLNLSMPLGRAPSAPRLSAGVGSRDRSQQAGLSGSFGAQRQGSYSVSANRARQQSTTFNAGVGYQASVTTLSAGYTQGPGSRGLSLGASGGVLIHGEGIHFSQQMGDTIGLLHAPGAQGAAVSNSVGVKTNAEGYAVVPYLQPYRMNQVDLDPKGLPLDVELKTASVRAVPTAGAVVKLQVETSSGRSALIQAPQTDGQPLPFGLDVYNEAGEVVGVVGQASRLWVRGVEEQGTLSVNLGSEKGQCRIAYDLTGAEPGKLIVGQCTP